MLVFSKVFRLFPNFNSSFKNPPHNWVTLPCYRHNSIGKYKAVPVQAWTDP
jgi:hypothetical protein